MIKLASFSPLIHLIYPDMTWRVEGASNKIYLTFDDGPIPEVTSFVLEELDKYQAKATFFCIGDNVRKYPDIFQQIVEGGHAWGNHTYHHLNGWQTDLPAYLENIKACDKEIEKYTPVSSLFRPPYGKLWPQQAKEVTQHKEIILWDVLSKDYDQNLSGRQVLGRCIKGCKSGSIVVFHDSLKAFPRLKYALPSLLDHLSERGYQFHSLFQRHI